MAIKKILMVCQAWPTFEHSGLAFCAGEHCTILSELGYQIYIASSDPQILEAVGKMPIKDAIYIPLDGFNFLTFRKDINQKKAQEVIDTIQPDLIIVEAWQTAIGDAFIGLASKSKIKLAMISHGISLHPFSWRPRDLARSLSWLPYRWLVFPGLIKKLTILSALDLHSSSKRFFDREIAKKLDVPVTLLVNAPVHYEKVVLPQSERKRQIITIGYFSDVKNQLAALQVAHLLKNQDIEFKFIGKKDGEYYNSCIKFVGEYGVNNCVFLDDDECEIASEIAASFCMLVTSTTEVLPLTILEAMACGTPFIATPKGSIPSLEGGLIGHSPIEQGTLIQNLLIDHSLWQKLSNSGHQSQRKNYSKASIVGQLQSMLTQLEAL
jgi:glycosyltransferase involved in cell wall biosynthesis